VADNRQFGSPKVPQFGDRSPGAQTSGQPGGCAECEANLADALDGTLTPAAQASFDAHMAVCPACAQRLADARRGAAWLELLRDPRPEPPAHLLERILSQTTGAQTTGRQTAGSPAAAELQLPGAVVAPIPAPLYGGAAPLPAGYAPAVLGKLIPFRSRFTSAVRASSFGQIMLQPRLAMTAAMAFFSIALTMDLTGVRLQDLHASDLRPGSLKRDFYSANARVVQYYEGLRVVYELESRVHDLQSASDNDAPAGAPAGVQTAPPASPNQPAAQPGPANPKPAPPADGSQPARKKAAPSPGSSRREDLTQTRRLVAATRDRKSFPNPSNARVERALA